MGGEESCCSICWVFFSQEGSLIGRTAFLLYRKYFPVLEIKDSVLDEFRMEKEKQASRSH